VVYNDMWDTDERLAQRCPQFRCSLAMAVSGDDGKTWCVRSCFIALAHIMPISKPNVSPPLRTVAGQTTLHRSVSI
jgi:hypothetical protein